MLSYAHGASTTPLLGETIGANLERTVARVPDAEALVSRHQGIRRALGVPATRGTRGHSRSTPVTRCCR